MSDFILFYFSCQFYFRLFFLNIFIPLNFFHATLLLLLLSLLSFAAFVTLIKQAQQEILWETSLDSKMRHKKRRKEEEKYQF